MPELSEILAKVCRTHVLSKMDLNKGFHHPDTREKTTISTPFSRYCYTKMPFGIKNAPAIFQDLTQRVLADCQDCAAVYTDDIIIYFQNETEHAAHVTRVLSALRVAGLTAKASKCQRGKFTLEYLGHMVGDRHYSIPESRLLKLDEYPRPVAKKDLRSYLGFVDYYRPFISNFANHSSKLIPSTSSKAPQQVAWTESMDIALNTLKKAVRNTAALTIPNIDDEFLLQTDGSGTGIVGVISVLREGIAHPTGFFSKQLMPHQHNYSATELEALAMTESI